MTSRFTARESRCSWCVPTSGNPASCCSRSAHGRATAPPPARPRRPPARRSRHAVWPGSGSVMVGSVPGIRMPEHGAAAGRCRLPAAKNNRRIALPGPILMASRPARMYTAPGHAGAVIQRRLVLAEPIAPQQIRPQRPPARRSRRAGFRLGRDRSSSGQSLESACRNMALRRADTPLGGKK
jgi:hypothetical protein